MIRWLIELPGEAWAAIFRQLFDPVSSTYTSGLVAVHTDEIHLLDVRDTDELEDAELGRTEVAQHIALGELRARAAEVPRDRPVATVGRSGKRSAQAALVLRNAGCERFANLARGMIEWSALSLPVVRV